MKKIEFITKDNHDFAVTQLKKYYDQKLIPAEKKTYLIDHEKSTGPYMACAGESQTGYIQDAASQIATLGLGFNPIAFFGVSHFEESWTNNLYSQNAKDIFKAFKGFLKERMHTRDIEVSYTNSGAEANEVALGFAFKRRRYKNAKKVLAFEGSFHGRLLVSLFSTWNKSKREPFEMAGFETTYAPFPEIKSSDFVYKLDQKWLALWENPFCEKFNFEIQELQKNADIQLNKEIDSLLTVKKQLETKEHFAVIVEAMQCEGGDRYGTNRFLNALTLLCKAHQTEIIIDEVQTGFNLGRDFFWHKTLNLVDSKQNTICPDYVTCAKKAQTGLVISTNGEYAQNNEIQFASVLRGFYHGMAINQNVKKIHDIENYTKKRLNEFINRWPQTHSPRVFGLAFAYDLKNEADVNKFIASRFNVGLLYYNAGSHTLRFRLNTAYSHEDIDYLFHALENLNAHIFDGAQLQPSKPLETKHRDVEIDYLWHQRIIKERMTTSDSKETMGFIANFFKKTFNLELIQFNPENFKTYKKQIEEIQKEVYEPARQTEIKKFEEIINSKTSIALGLLKEDKLVAISFAGVMSLFPLESGLRLTRHFTNPKALYMLDTTSLPVVSGLGIGRFLKYSVELIGCNLGLEYIYGRNRNILAAGMLNINLSLGLIPELYIKENYLDDEDNRDVLIYRSPLKWKSSSVIENSTSSPLLNAKVDFEFIKNNHSELVNKICLSNFVSQKFLDNIEYLSHLVPQDLRHMYTTSGQSECADKVYKSISFKAKNKSKQKVISFKGHYFGNGSFLARTLSNEADPFFQVTHFDHPTKSNEDDLIKQINEALTSNEYIALFIEPSPQFLKAEDVSQSFLTKLKYICDKHETRIVLNLTSEFMGFDFNALPIIPNAIMAYLGGQAGVCYLDLANFVEDPLMLISTWDGDAHSTAQFVRAHTLNSKISLSAKEEVKEKFLHEYNLELVSGDKFKQKEHNSFLNRKELPKSDVFIANTINILKD